MYQLTQATSILRIADSTFIPPDLDNLDYRNYLKWLEQGNQPLPAPEPAPIPAPLTPEQKLATAGLTVTELKQLLGLE
tara:strand:+ start:8311 stop:8544 length:234 start_codon:yes stop_codon:yes gene_type:complete